MKPGFRKIPNDLYCALVAVDLTRSGYKVILAVINETLGFQRLDANIPLSKFMKLTRLSKHGVINAIHEIEGKGMVFVNRHSTTKSLYHLKAVEDWVTSEAHCTSKRRNAVHPTSPDECSVLHQTSEVPTTTATDIKETIKENHKDIVIKITYAAEKDAGKEVFDSVSSPFAESNTSRRDVVEKGTSPEDDPNNAWLVHRHAILGASIIEAIELCYAFGSPPIPEGCDSIESLLFNQATKDSQVLAIKQWLVDKKANLE